MEEPRFLRYARHWREMVSAKLQEWWMRYEVTRYHMSLGLQYDSLSEDSSGDGGDR